MVTGAGPGHPSPRYLLEYSTLVCYKPSIVVIWLKSACVRDGVLLPARVLAERSIIWGDDEGGFRRMDGWMVVPPLRHLVRMTQHEHFLFPTDIITRWGDIHTEPTYQPTAKLHGRRFVVVAGSHKICNPPPPPSLFSSEWK